MFQRLIKEIPPIQSLPFPKLHLTTVRNTLVGCTACLTNRFNFVRRSDGSMYMNKCQACQGTGNTFINEDLTSVRDRK